MKHAIAITILAVLSALVCPAADTSERRGEYVSTAILPHVRAIPGDITPIPGAPGVYTVPVWVDGTEGIRRLSQRFVYLHADDSYALCEPVRRNYVAPGPSEQQQVFAALQAAIGTFDDVNGWSPSTKTFTLGGKQIQLVSLTQNGQHVAYWGGAEVSGFGLVTKRVDDLR